MEVKMYGADWCKDCIRTKRVLEDKQVEYSYFSIEEDPSLADKVITYNEQAGYGSKRRIPIILIGDRILSEPSDEVLMIELQQAGLL
jgi:glutaredoxin